MSAETSASVRPTSGISPAWSWAATRSAAAAARRSASISAASFTARSGPTTSVPRRHASTPAARPGGRARTGPTCGRRWRRSPPRPVSPATTAMGSSVSSQVRSVNTSGRSTTRGASSRGTTRVASPSRGQDEHREALERHRLVPAQPRQVGPDRQQQHVDADLAHPSADPVDPIGEHHPAQLPDSRT